MATSKAPLKRSAKAKTQIDSLLRNDMLQKERESITRKALNMSFANRLHQERKEAETEAACANAKVSQGWRSEELIQEDKLAQEMVKDKCQWLKGIKKSEFVKNSEEIRELIQKLQYAYLNKDMAIQLAERNALELRRKDQEKEEIEQLIQNERFIQQLEVQNRIEEEKKKMKYKEQLQDQMIEKQKIREEAFRNQLDEKQFIDESIRTVSEEDKRDEELKMIRKKMAKEEAEAMLIAKKLWIEKERKIQEEEDRKIREYLEEKGKKEKELQEVNKKKEEGRWQNRIACVNIIRTSEEQRRELQRITQILIDEDVRKKEEEKSRKELEKKHRMAYELKEITAKQIEIRLKRMEEEKLEEMKFCQKLLEENRRNILHEQEELKRKRRENLDYGRSLKSIMDMQVLNKLRMMEEQYQQHKLELEQIQKRRAIIDEERIKILNEHVGNLIGFIPKGVIRKEDLPHLSPEIRQFYATPTDDRKQ